MPNRTHSTAARSPITRTRVNASQAGRDARVRTASARTAVLAVIALAMILTGLAILFSRNNAANATGTRDANAPTGSEVEFLLGDPENGDLMAGENMVIQIPDKDDPTQQRLAAEILADRYDPDGPTIRLVEKPKAWLFGDNGSAWLIESDRGRFYIPEGENQPREGTLTGNVTARKFDPAMRTTGVTAMNRPDPNLDTPSLIATTDEPLRFNLDILTFETDGRLAITTDTIDFAGRGAYVVLNETRESITTLRVDQGERLVYTPLTPPASDPHTDPEAIPQTNTTIDGPTGTLADAGPNPTSSTSPSAVASSARPANTAPTAAPPTQVPNRPPTQTTTRAQNPHAKIDLYRISFADNVEAVSGPQTITSDTLTVWTRLIDNQLPDRSPGGSARTPHEAAMHAAFAAPPASAPQRVGDPVGVENPEAEFQNAASQDPQQSQLQDQPADPEGPNPVVLTWDGPLTVEPLTDSPDELNRGDDLALRFEANNGDVEIVDTTADATANALAANYFAQRERVELEGSGGSIVVASERTGRIEGMNAVEIELASGVITIPTAGVLFGKDHVSAAADPTPQTIAWSESAAFRFATEDGKMTDRLERAGFRGRVRGANRDATVDGETLVALFDTPPDESPRLLQLDVEKAIAKDGRDGSVGGETMQVHFARGTYGEDIDPTRAILTGDAFARRTGRESIRGQRIDAALARDSEAHVIVTIAEADGDVAFDDGAGTAGRGDALIADTLEETAVITGPADPARTWVSRDGTRITGPDIRLNGSARTVEVVGAGTFAHRGMGDPSSGQAAPRSIDAAWTERMSFDDLAGSVLCQGGVSATSPGPDGSVDTVTGDRLEITLAPVNDSQPSPTTSPGDTQSAKASENGDRLRFAEVFGTAASPARVESTRYAPGAAPQDAADPDRPIESLYRLDAPRIRFAAADDRISVPTAGRLFVLDRSPPDDQAPGKPEPTDKGENPLIGGDGSRGSTLITWTGSMDFDRTEGRAVVREDARIVNKPIGKPFPSDVIANTITASFHSANDGERDGAASTGDLRWAIAEGDALLRIENDREILADRLIYDPENRRIQALGENGNRVEITDLARGSVQNARAIIWDLAIDRITFTNPGAIISPE